MAFIVEDGTNVPGATSYASVEFVDAYFIDRGNAGWTGSASVKQAALIQATDYIDLRFGDRFIGNRKYEDQSLEWPRVAGSRDYGMPTVLLQATAEYAVRALSGPLAPDPSVDPSGYALQSTKEKVGPLEEAKTFATSQGGINRPAMWIPYPIPDSLIRRLLRSPGGRVIRN